jgi:chromosome segregation ATPase
MDQQELIPFLEKHFSQIDTRFNRIEARLDGVGQEIVSLREETAQEFASVREDLHRVEEKADHTQILLEDMRDHIRILAEGLIGYYEKLDSMRSQPTLKIEDVLTVITPYYQGLDNRLQVIEGWADRQNEDVLELVRKRVLAMRQEPL